MKRPQCTHAYIYTHTTTHQFIHLPVHSAIHPQRPCASHKTIKANAHTSHAQQHVRPTNLICVIPLLVAMMSTGARSLSNARFSQEKHSMSNMCTCGVCTRFFLSQTRRARIEVCCLLCCGDGCIAQYGLD